MDCLDHAAPSSYGVLDLVEKDIMAVVAADTRIEVAIEGFGASDCSIIASSLRATSINVLFSNAPAPQELEKRRVNARQVFPQQRMPAPP